MIIEYKLIQPSALRKILYHFNEPKNIKSSSFDIHISYKKITEFKHLFKFKISVSLIGDNNSSISFVHDFLYDISFDGVVEFPSKPELYHLELLLDVVIEVMAGVNFHANNIKEYDSSITANLFYKFSEAEIISALKQVKTIYSMDEFSAN
jgi:hypothetical protein